MFCDVIWFLSNSLCDFYPLAKSYHITKHGRSYIYLWLKHLASLCCISSLTSPRLTSVVWNMHIEVKPLSAQCYSSSCENDTFSTRKGWLSIGEGHFPTSKHHLVHFSMGDQNLGSKFFFILGHRIQNTPMKIQQRMVPDSIPTRFNCYFRTCYTHATNKS
jgi:hypothetical protein